MKESRRKAEKRRLLRRMLRHHRIHVRERLAERYELYLTEYEIREIETNIRGGFCTVLSYDSHGKIWRVFVPWNGNAIKAAWSVEKDCLVSVLPWED
jgi:hypothetical protein